MTNRQPVHPAPPPPFTPPEVSPTLNQDAGLSAAERLTHWWAVLALGWLCWLCIGGLWLIVFTPEELELRWVFAYVLAGLIPLLGIGVHWLLLPWHHDRARVRFQTELWGKDIDDRHAGHKVLRGIARDWSAHWNGEPQHATTTTTFINRETGTVTARVTTVPMPRAPQDGDTRQLPALPEGGLVYEGGPLWAIVAAHLAGERPSVRNRPAGMSRELYEAATEQLIAGGVLIKAGLGRGLQFHADLGNIAKTPTAVVHARVAKRLGLLSPTVLGVPERGILR